MRYKLGNVQSKFDNETMKIECCRVPPEHASCRISSKGHSGVSQKTLRLLGAHCLEQKRSESRTPKLAHKSGLNRRASLRGLRLFLLSCCCCQMRKQVKREKLVKGFPNIPQDAGFPANQINLFIGPSLQDFIESLMRLPPRSFFTN